MKKKLVIYDFQAFMSMYGGVPRYFAEIINEISKSEKYKVKIGSVGSYNTYMNKYHYVIALPGWTRKLEFVKKLIPLLNRLYMKLLVLIYKDAIFHVTYYNPYLLEYKPTHLVCTVYDMILEKFPNLFPDAETAISNKKKYIYESERIFAISECTKRDLLKIYPDIDEQKVRVVYLATDMRTSEECEPSNTAYFLFVGDRKSYKNFGVLVKALAYIKNEYNINLQLKCIGGGKFDQEESDAINGLGLNNQVVQLVANDAELAWYYQNAICFVYPSMYEGFGIPILEGFACGCPEILCDASCFPEIAGDAAVYFKDDDYVDLAKKMHAFYTDDKLRMMYKEKGYQQLKNYSWTKSAELTMSGYDESIKMRCD